MKPTSDKLKTALANGYLSDPRAMLKIDIDPPFVGREFRPESCDPDLSLIGGVLYLTIVEGDYIKILTVDRATHKVSGMVREILALGATRPRLIFEPSIYPGWPDLPHVAYTAGGKAMVYREQYNAEGAALSYWDEIGNGSHCETVRMGNTVIDFYIGTDGILYSRFQGEYAEALIDLSADGELITSARVIALPDARFLVQYTVRKPDGLYQDRVSWSEMLGEKIINETFSISIDAILIELKQSSFQFNESFDLLIEANLIELLSSSYRFDESFSLDIDINHIAILEPKLINESFELVLGINHILMESPQRVNESFQISIGVNEVALV